MKLITDGKLWAIKKNAGVWGWDGWMFYSFTENKWFSETYKLNDCFWTDKETAETIFNRLKS